MAWFVYDYDKAGGAIQRGPFFSEGEAQSKLDRCEDPKAFKIYWKTRQKSVAKSRYRELMKEKGKSNDEVLCNIWNGESYDKRKSKAVDSVGTGQSSSLVNMPDPYSGIQSIKDEVQNSSVLD
jgi:hypothetical protein